VPGIGRGQGEEGYLCSMSLFKKSGEFLRGGGSEVIKTEEKKGGIPFAGDLGSPLAFLEGGRPRKGHGRKY